MKKFKIGDVVRLKTDSPERLRLIVRSIDSDRLECTSECERRRVISHGDDFELVERPDPQADMKQAIREVLLSDEFMTMFAAAFLSASVPQLTLEDLIPGVNRPMRNEAQLSKMVEMVRQSLTPEPNPSEIPNSSSEPMRAAFEAEMVKRYGEERASFARTEKRYFDSSMEIAWQAFQAGAKHGDPSGGWHPTKDEIEYALDRCGVPASDPINSANKQPPKGYRMLGPAKDEPRRSDDLCWSMSDQDWVQIDRCVFQANRDNWAACRKIKVTSPLLKRYREPTLADLANGPIFCESRDHESHDWKTRVLTDIVEGPGYLFLCLSAIGANNALRYAQCRIEVTDDPT